MSTWKGYIIGPNPIPDEIAETVKELEEFLNTGIDIPDTNTEETNEQASDTVERDNNSEG